MSPNARRLLGFQTVHFEIHAERADLSSESAENFSPVVLFFFPFRCLAFTSSAFPSVVTGLSHNYLNSFVDGGEKRCGRSGDGNEGDDGLAFPVSKGAHISVVSVEPTSPTNETRAPGGRRVSTGEGYICVSERGKCKHHDVHTVFVCLHSIVLCWGWWGYVETAASCVFTWSTKPAGSSLDTMPWRRKKRL